VSALSLIANSQEDAASTLGIDVRTFARWLKRGCPGKPRAYIIRDCIQWARKHAWSEDAVIAGRATGEAGNIDTEYLREKLGKLRRDNQMADMKMEMSSRRFVDADRVKTLLSQQADMMRTGLEKLEREHGPEALDLVLELIQELESIDLANATD
jgi:hypothetical protein